MTSYHIWTIGCQMNRAESERLAAYFERLGCRAAATDEADLIVLNSCVVRQSAEDRVVNKLDALRLLKEARPALTLAVTGCLVNADTAHLKQRFPYVDHFFPPGQPPPWPGGNGWEQILPARPAPSAGVTIIQGCNNFCTYCIVPYRRGREKSRPPAEITAEVRGLVERGVQEVTLLGQNVDAYGHDLPAATDLAALLEGLNTIPGLRRLRFLTSHPRDMSSRLLAAMARPDKVCEYLSLPVQAGSDEVLAAMGRGYTVADYRRLIAEARRTIPGLALSTDVIVGFPGETGAQFRQTLGLLAEVRFDTVHVAAYSPRPGTAAAALSDDVPAAEKKRRLAEVERLQEAVAGEINAGLRGKTVEVLVAGRKKGRWYGRSRGDKLVFFGDGGNHLGKLVNVSIEKTSPWSLQGRLEG